MGFRVLLPPIFALTLALSGALTAAAQTSRPLPAALKADRITYASGYKVLRASGHVVITKGNTVLTASALTYDARNNMIRAEGPLRLIDGDRVMFLADFAELSDDLKQGILKSARMVLNKQIQLTAARIVRSGGRHTELLKAAASSCTVTRASPTPLWQIRASRILHDEQKKQLLFVDAQLRFGKVPVAWIPRLKLPDPSVHRANGFLVPEFNNSSSLGSSAGIPYFLTLGDYADVTLTPTLFTSGTATLGIEFRKRFHRGDLNIKAALTRDTVSTHDRRAYLFANGDWRLGNRFKARMKLQLTSDSAYMREHSIFDGPRLENSLGLDRTTRDSRFSADFTAYRDLTGITTVNQIPMLMGDASLQRQWGNPVLGGRLGLTLEATSYLRRSTTDILGRDGRRVGLKIDWQRQWTGRAGSVLQTTALLRADSYGVQQDSSFASTINRGVPILAADWRLPLGRSRGDTQEVLEPRLQLVWSPGSTVAVPNETSRLVEFGVGNLFSLDHFTGADLVEKGLRANIGVTYGRRSQSGWNFDAMLGQVLRLRDEGQFTAASGLSGTASSVVMAVQVSRADKLRLVHRMVAGAGTGISRSETRLALAAGKVDFDTSYTWLAANAAGNTTNRSEWQMQTGWNVFGNWRAQADWRYDLAASGPVNAGVSLSYRNECLKVDLSLSRQFVSSSNVTASTNIAVKVALEGFGMRSLNTGNGRACADF